jgi:hypothetical protein
MSKRTVSDMDNTTLDHCLRPLKGQFSTAFMARRLENWKLFFGEERFVKLQVYYTLNT